MTDHHPRHRFDPSKARNLLDPTRRLIADPVQMVREMGVKPGLRVGDFGCGPGFFTPALLEVVGPAGRVVAVDDEPAMLELLRERLPQPAPRVQILAADVRATGLPAAALDGVFFAFTLHEVESLLALREAWRVLTPGGVVLALEWGTAPCPERGDGRPAGPPMDHRLSVEKLAGLMEEVGFREISGGERLGGCQYWRTGRKP